LVFYWKNETESSSLVVQKQIPLHRILKQDIAEKQQWRQSLRQDAETRIRKLERQLGEVEVSKIQLEDIQDTMLSVEKALLAAQPVINDVKLAEKIIYSVVFTAMILTLARFFRYLIIGRYLIGFVKLMKAGKSSYCNFQIFILKAC
jgi:hypothetical protein